MNETANKTMNETSKIMNDAAKKIMRTQKQRMRTQIPSEQLTFNGQLGLGALGPGPRAQNTD